MIAQCLCYGDSLKSSCVAVVIPDEIWANNWARENNVEGNFAAICQSEELNKVIMDDIQRLAAANNFSSLERPKAIYLSSDAFSVENDTLTPTMKMKRHQTSKVYKAQIDEMYKTLTALEAARDAKVMMQK